jgi:hypothetical protein
MADQRLNRGAKSLRLTWSARAKQNWLQNLIIYSEGHLKRCLRKRNSWLVGCSDPSLWASRDLGPGDDENEKVASEVDGRNREGIRKICRRGWSL